MIARPELNKDFYKADHRRQYPEGTEMVYSNMTARSNKLAKFWPRDHEDKIVFFGLQYFLKHYLSKVWEEEFFKKPKDEILKRYKRRMDNALGKDAFPLEHIADLHNLGYLPVMIKALPEGARVPIGVPFLTIKNTQPKFFWITNFLETVMSCFLWKPITSATTAYEYRRLFDWYAKETGAAAEFAAFQGHDFSFRGMVLPQEAILSGAAHLLSFVGTDTIPAIDFLEDYYEADSDKELIGCSVSATEHSVMCMGGQETEYDTFRRLIAELYPTGIISIVSDTWDFWKVVTETIPSLKDTILAREGKVVLRPDSGDPVKIIVGDPNAKFGTPQYNGLIQELWRTFKGTRNGKGFKELDSHIGAIYGDSITLERADQILSGLQKKGFASSNIVLGLGAYTYEFVTRDTHGFAIKATAGKINGELIEISKDPKTDDGVKKSAKGLLRVEKDEQGNYILHQQQTEDEEKQGELEVVFKNGLLQKPHTLSEIRGRLHP